MKTKYAIIIWFVGLIILIISILFKIQHWPFASEMAIVAIIGDLLRVTGFILFVYKFYKYPNKKEILIKNAVVVWLTGFIIFFIGAIFKIQHWPFAGYIMTFGMLLETIGLILFAYKLYKYPKIKEFLNF